MQPGLTDSRRLTGANLFWDLPAAIIDAGFGDGDGSDPAAFIAAWTDSARSLLQAVDRPEEQLASRVHDTGMSLLISAPVDVLYSMCELNEAAFEMARSSFEPAPSFDMDSRVARHRQLFEEEC